MIKPDYEQGSIVNLMASISQALGSTKRLYNPLDNVAPNSLAQSDNIILIVIDGLGFEFIQKYDKDSFLAQHIQQSLTSVFPSTTATAITAFATGVPAQQHAITGWHVYFKEINQVLAVLPFVERGDSKNSYSYQDMQSLLNIPEPIMNCGDREKYVVSPRYIVDSLYSRYIHGMATRLGYEKLDQCFNKITDICSVSKNKKYIYAYWPEFDSTCHQYGVDHAETFKLFKYLDKQFEALCKSLENNNYSLMLTADHGLINSGEENTIVLNDYPEILDCLEQPLCGEPRAAFCYVKPGKLNKFRSLIVDQLGQFCNIYETQELIDTNTFGLFDENENLKSRAGDFVLIMKEHYAIQSYLEGEREFMQTAVHGGFSSEEMLVPLVKLDNL